MMREMSPGMDPEMNPEMMQGEVDDDGAADEAKLAVLDEIHELMGELEERGLMAHAQKKSGAKAAPAAPAPAPAPGGEDDLAKLQAISRE